jgi:predicted small lipoprotein YifL
MTRLLQSGTVLSIAFLAIACLSSCGRRGALEAPPGAIAPTASAEAPAQSGTETADASASVKPSSRRTKKIVPPKRDTPLDWLL